MEFPDLGKHCHLVTCRKLDFLPFTCDACKEIFCNEHVGYDSHSCQESFKKDRRIPVCPLCNEPISSRQNDNPDQVVNQHIENDCKSDLARGKRKTYTNSCCVKGCKQREVVPVTCASCKRNFCVRHRHENDHDCRRREQSSAVRLPEKPTYSHNTYQRPGQQTQALSQNSNRQVMSDDEALARAIQASLRDQRSNRQPSETPSKPTSQEEEDMNLARALAASEEEERNRQRRLNQTQSNSGSSQTDGNSCAVS